MANSGSDWGLDGRPGLDTSTPSEPPAGNSGGGPNVPPGPVSDLGPRKTCPLCAEGVSAAAHICHFCGYSFDDGTSAEQRAAVTARANAIEAAQKASGRKPSLLPRILIQLVFMLFILFFVGFVLFNAIGSIDRAVGSPAPTIPHATPTVVHSSSGGLLPASSPPIIVSPSAGL